MIENRRQNHILIINIVMELHTVRYLKDNETCVINREERIIENY